VKLFLTVMIVAVLAAFETRAAPPAEVRALPYWSSDRIRAARPLTPEPALAFDVEDTVTSGAGPAKVRHLSVTLASSFTRVSGGDAEVLDDHALCRVLAWTPGQPVLANDNCLSFLAFRTLEIRNREHLRDLMSRIGAKPGSAFLEPYWDEAELGVQTKPGDLLSKRTVDGAAEYRLGDDVVARVSGAASPLDPDERRRFARYLALHVQMHPQLRRDLAAAGVLPGRLEIKTHPAGASSTEVFVFTHVRRAPAAYPLPPHLRAQLDLDIAQGEQPRPRGQRQAMLAIEGRSTIPKPSAKALIDSIRATVAAHRPVDGLLMFLELTQQYYGSVFVDPSGAALLAQLRPLAGRVINDPTVQPFWTASQLAGSRNESGDREAAARYLATARLDDAQFGTFRYVTFANLIINSGDTSKWDPAIFKAMPKAFDDNYWIHIAAYPWSSFAFKDAGDYYMGQYEPQNAWIAYDLGRAVDPDWRRGPMDEIRKFEEQLRTQEPDFF
jgi:hypothetical protein